MSVALAQPLPALQWREGTDAYSEFASLGLAIVGGALREAGVAVDRVHHPGSEAELLAAARDVDTLVLGDFRYYAYFCNPLPLIHASLAALEHAGWAGRVLVAGRHAAHIPALDGGPRIRVERCADMRELARALGAPPSALGTGALPRPALPPLDLLLDAALSGSVSRPVGGAAGQLMVEAGCRFRCAFCEKAGTTFGRIAAARAEIAAHLRACRDRGVEYVIFWDEVFGAEPGIYGDVLGALRDAALRFGCNTRAEVLTDDFVDALAEAGCDAVLLGVELGADDAPARRALRVDRGKSPNTAALRGVVDRLQARGVRAVGSVLIGLPDDTEERVGLRLAQCSAAGFDRLYVRPVVPFPEADLYAGLVSAGTLPPYRAWSAAAWDTYPHGYPTLSASIDRRRLCTLAGR